MHASKITTKGQITIPQEYRKILDIHPGDRVAFEPDAKGGLRIKKIESRVSLAGCLKTGIRAKASDQAIEEAIKQGWANSGSD